MTLLSDCDYLVSNLIKQAEQKCGQAFENIMSFFNDEEKEAAFRAAAESCIPGVDLFQRIKDEGKKFLSD